MFTLDLAALDSFALAVILLLALVVPLLGITEFRVLQAWLRSGRQSARVRFYFWVMGVEWVMALGLLLWWLGLDGGPSALGVMEGLGRLGLIPRMGGYQIYVVALGLLATWVLFPQMNRVLEDDDDLRQVRDSMKGLWALAPRNHDEQRVFLWLSITAGVCEELLYRGFLQHVLTGVLGVWPALVLTSLIFGLGHVYQGAGGILKTGGVGLVFGLLALFSGSLYTGMILHAAVDLTSGRMLQGAVQVGRWPRG